MSNRATLYIGSCQNKQEYSRLGIGLSSLRGQALKFNCSEFSNNHKNAFTAIFL